MTSSNYALLIAWAKEACSVLRVIEEVDIVNGKSRAGLVLEGEKIIKELGDRRGDC